MKKIAAEGEELWGGGGWRGSVTCCGLNQLLYIGQGACCGTSQKINIYPHPTSKPMEHTRSAPAINSVLETVRSFDGGSPLLSRIIDRVTSRSSLLHSQRIVKGRSPEKG